MTATLHCGDALAVLKTLPDGCSRCCVTSPPYWGLRDYGTATWEGGDAECDHKQATARNDGGRANVGGFHGSAAPDSDKGAMNYRHACGKCGARRVDSQLGLEPTPEEYVANLVAVFREVRRVLADDGTLWLNLGDSYHAAPKGSDNGWDKSGLTKPNGRERAAQTAQRASIGNGKRFTGTKPKDLVGIPWLVAFALRADGWYLRCDIIWSKPNPMPESVTDRPTKAHEYLFLLSKRARYFYDADAIAEESVSVDDPRYGGPRIAYDKKTGPTSAPDYRGQRSAVTIRPIRNARSVWTIATQPYAQAHFATFPEELARRCIVAGSAPGDVVLDPFGGSGTVAQVATGNGRQAIHIELNPKYIELARQRIGPMLCGAA